MFSDHRRAGYRREVDRMLGRKEEKRERGRGTFARRHDPSQARLSGQVLAVIGMGALKCPMATSRPSCLEIVDGM